MRQVSFEKSLKYASKDIIIQSDILKNYVKKSKTKDRYLKLIADEVPMPMKVANEALKAKFSNISYIEIMSDAKFFVVDY